MEQAEAAEPFDQATPAGKEPEGIDPEFARELSRLPGAAGLYRCYTCATCTAGCPVRCAHPEYDPRKIIRLVLLGRRAEVLASPLIWLCSTCYACQERCPQDVKVTDLLNVLRNLAARSGHRPDPLRMQEDLLLKFGRLYEIDEFDNKKREKAGLPVIAMKNEDVVKLHGMLREKPLDHCPAKHSPGGER